MTAPTDAGRAAPATAGRDPEALIVANGVTLRCGRHTLLDGVDLTVYPAEITSIIGPNGAGKTTLLKVILGLLRPSSGRIWRRPGVRIGYVPQHLRIDPVLPITVRRLMTLTVRRSADAVRRALAETGVAHLMEAGAATLSGGEMQRVLLARALLVDPELLVLDEPLQGIDFAGEAALYDLIGDLRRRRGCGVILVSHDLHIVMAATDHVLCLNRHVCCAGTADAVGRDPEYARLFGPRAAHAFAVYTHHHDHAHAPSGDVVSLPSGDADTAADAAPPAEGGHAG